jgi:hypothetical protein
VQVLALLEEEPAPMRLALEEASIGHTIRLHSP